MESKRNLKYYVVSGPPVFQIIGLAFLAFAAVVLLVGIRAWTLYAILAGIVGLAILVISSGGKANDTDIDYECQEKVKDIEEDAEKRFDVYERSFLKMIRPLTFSGFQFSDDPALLCRKGADGRHRSTIFGATAILFTNEKLHIYTKRFSLVSGEEPEIAANIYYYTKLDRAYLDTKTYTYVRKNKQFSLETYQFVIVDMEGNEVYRMFVDYGADIDKAVDDINHVFAVRKKAAEERAAERAAEKAAKEAAAKQNL